LIDIYAPPQTADAIRANLPLLNDADVILSGWAARRSMPSCSTPRPGSRPCS